MKKEEKQENNIEKSLKDYRPIEGPELWQLKWGLWWVENRMLLRHIFIIILIVAGTLFWGYTIYGFGYYAYKGIQEDEVLAQDLISIPKISHNYTSGTAAQDLVLGSINVLPGIKNTSDLAVEIKNLNSSWYAVFDYFFIINQQETEIKSEFMLPGEKKYLTEFLYEGSRPTGASINIANLKWRRISPKDIGSSVESYLADNANIEISDIQINPAGAVSVSAASAMILKAKNNTPYNFWSVDFYFALKSGYRLVGINKYQIEKFLSGEEKEISFSWLGASGGSQVEVIPSVNIFDQENLMPFNLGSGQLK
ncbi:MAG: hypothetical protein WC323_01700 [Patescibacteria group bacterium]|jgi:hypothetical protein